MADLTIISIVRMHAQTFMSVKYFNVTYLVSYKY